MQIKFVTNSVESVDEESYKVAIVNVTRTALDDDDNLIQETSYNRTLYPDADMSVEDDVVNTECEMIFTKEVKNEYIRFNIDGPQIVAEVVE